MDFIHLRTVGAPRPPWPGGGRPITAPVPPRPPPCFARVSPLVECPSVPTVPAPARCGTTRRKRTMFSRRLQVDFDLDQQRRLRILHFCQRATALAKLPPSCPAWGLFSGRLGRASGRGRVRMGWASFSPFLFLRGSDARLRPATSAATAGRTGGSDFAELWPQALRRQSGGGGKTEDTTTGGFFNLELGTPPEQWNFRG